MATLGRSSRTSGVDVARGLALLGIMAVHIFPPLRADGGVHPAFLLDSGRAPALFPLLAGVGLALGHGGTTPSRGRRLWSERVGIGSRAALLIVVGLLLGRVDSPPLVILVHFGFMFLAATLFIGLRARTLLTLAVVWVLAAPTLSFFLRTGPAGSGGSPQLPGLLSSGQGLVNLWLTSEYPVLVWLTYVLAGLAIGRYGLQDSRPVRLVSVGLALAIAGKGASMLLLGVSGGPDALEGHTEGLQVYAPDLATQLQVGLPGTTPTTDWRWLLVSAPHSGTTFDLLHTGGVAIAILGLCLLAVRRFGRGRLLPLVAAGSMTLTLYSLHVLSLWRGGPLADVDPFLLYVGEVVVVLVAATLWRSYLGRGPLEGLAAWLDQVSRGVFDALAGGRKAGHTRSDR